MTLVVALIVSLSLPALGTGCRSGRRVKDASNVRGIVQANILWALGDAEEPRHQDKRALDGDDAPQADSGN
jgi:hypothetical protein